MIGCDDEEGADLIVLMEKIVNDSDVDHMCLRTITEHLKLAISGLGYRESFIYTCLKSFCGWILQLAVMMVRIRLGLL